MIENFLDKLKAWEEIENRAMDIFDIYRVDICEEKDKTYRFLDYIDVSFEKKHVTLYFDELLPSNNFETHCNWMEIPFEYFSGEKDVKEYFKSLDI